MRTQGSANTECASMGLTNQEKTKRLQALRGKQGFGKNPEKTKESCGQCKDFVGIEVQLSEFFLANQTGYSQGEAEVRRR